MHVHSFTIENANLTFKYLAEDFSIVSKEPSPTTVVFALNTKRHNTNSKQQPFNFNVNHPFHHILTCRQSILTYAIT